MPVLPSQVSHEEVPHCTSVRDVSNTRVTVRHERHKAEVILQTTDIPWGKYHAKRVGWNERALWSRYCTASRSVRSAVAAVYRRYVGHGVSVVSGQWHLR